MTTQNRKKSNAKKNKKTSSLYILNLSESNLTVRHKEEQSLLYM